MKTDNIEEILGIASTQNIADKRQTDKSQEDSGNNSTFSNEANEKYSALRIVIGLISFLAYTIITIGVLALFALLSKDQILMGFASLVVSVVIALPLLAFSNLIYVFIDIEFNTRKTRETLRRGTI